MTTKAVTRVCITIMALGVLALDFLANYTGTDSHGWNTTAGIVLIVLALAWFS